MPGHKEKKHIFAHDNGAVVEVHTDWTHPTLYPLTYATVEIKLHDYSGGNQITLWHNGERWIVRHDEQSLGRSQQLRMRGSMGTTQQERSPRAVRGRLR